MLIIPAIDLRQGRCVRLTQGRKEESKTYEGDPFEIAQSYEEAGAQMLHVVDLDSAFGEDRSINRQALGRIIGSVGVPVQFGGGLRSRADVEELISIGAHRVVIGTLAVESPEELERLVERFGSRICVGIDARDGQVMTRGWEKPGRISAVELARRVAGAGVERIVYTDVARDGTLGGVNIEQTCMIAQESGLKVTASGGVSTLEDIRRLKNAGECGIDSVIVGKALCEGRFTLGEALREGRASL
ncbi:MAG TPA: 1-(5-phosphoribosyl)-5-[(5-phosphoribosylamino)methylideneamino]imidazole-4-carboxamide isomerase [Pyrinomonadaceae bacterium]|jgi:phosphoribosylformimino-5-aminoimidazole carboxamide ribotide isomerase